MEKIRVPPSDGVYYKSTGVSKKYVANTKNNGYSNKFRNRGEVNK